MIDNNIIQSLGAGSGIDTNSLVKQLTSIERDAPQSRIDGKRDLTETKISDFGLLSSSLSTLQAAAKVLTDPEGLFSKSASFTDSDALKPSKLDTTVQPGIYNFEVNQTARSQALGFAEFTSMDDAVGEGTLTFNFGNWARDGADLPTGFTQDGDSESVTITIDSTNNSLKGLRDAINDADMGVTASIVNTGSGFKLSLLAESGANNELQITAAEGASPGLSAFAFDETTTGIETQFGRDALLTINGLEVSRSSNTVDDVVDGLTLDLYKAAPGETVTVTVSDDKTFAEQNIRDFVDAYNLFLEETEQVFGTKEVTDEEGNTEKVQGSLAGDALAKSVLSRIRATISSAIPGLTNSDYTAVTNLGIRTELDGTLSIDEDDFRTAMDDRFEDVQKVLAPQTYSDANGITVNSYGANTAAGSYDVVITTPPSKGSLDGGSVGALTFPIDTSAKDYSFKVELNGTESDTITVAAGTYNNETELAAALQSAINSDAKLQGVNAVANVSYDSDNSRFVFTSNQYGVNSNFSILEASAEIELDLGMGVATGTAGTKVAGTINGVEGFGSANVLLPKLGSAGEGLAMIIGENATSGTVSFSRGFAGEIEDLITQFLGKEGPIATRETSLEKDLTKLDDDQERLDRKMSAFQDRLMNQFINMERIINGLNSSGSFLDNLIDTLPFTAKRD